MGATPHERAARLTALSSDWPDLHLRASEVFARTETSEFRIAVVGEFKRGKSTLLNALLERDVLPTGVLPVTAVPIEITAGNDDAAIFFGDGRQNRVEFGELEQYTAESHNPGNRLGVTKVELRVMSELLLHGLTLRDVPGMGSIHEGATDTALATYQKVDGAVLVLSMDSPLSAVERRAALDIEARGARLFVVVNKSDRFKANELAEVRRFVATQLERPVESIYCLSAREALIGRFEEANDYLTFRHELRRFVADDLIRTRNGLLLREIGLIGTAIGERANLELLAGEIDISELETKIRSLQQAISHERTRHDGDRRAVASEVAALSSVVRARLLEDAQRSYRTRRNDFIAGLVRQGNVDSARREASQHIEVIVREEFAHIWMDAATWIDEQWQQVVERHRDETEMRLGAVRSVATELFSVELLPGQVPALARHPEENLYYFPPAMSLADGLLDPLRRLVPASLVRRQLEEKATEMLLRELEKHAGRSAAFLCERLERSWRDFDQSTERYLDEAVRGIVDALDRASRIRAETETNVRARRSHLERLIIGLAEVGAKP